MWGAAFVFMLLGLGAVSLAMDRHVDHLPRKIRTSRLRWMLRLVGWIALLVAMRFAVADSGAAMGFLVWLGMLLPCTLLVAFLLMVLSRR